MGECARFQTAEKEKKEKMTMQELMLLLMSRRKELEYSEVQDQIDFERERFYRDHYLWLRSFN